MDLIKLVAGLIYLAHLLGCFWFGLADSHSTLDLHLHRTDSSSGIRSEDEETGYLRRLHEFDDDAPPGTWIEAYDHGSGVTSTVWVQYLYSVYWALTTLTTVGYGDLVPVNDTERCATLLVQLVATLVFGYLLSAVAALIVSVDPNAVKIQEKVDEVKVYLRWHKFEPELALRVRRYYEFYYARKSAVDEQFILDNLAPTLRVDVQAHLLGATCRRIPLFQEGWGYVTLELQLAVHAKLRPILREAKEGISAILEKGHEGGDAVFFMRRGAIEARASSPDVRLGDVDASET